jgi:hypothetical protein
MESAIEQKLKDAGYRMLGDRIQTEKLIVDILKTKNIRYLKAIPFLLYKYKPDIHEIYTKTSCQELFCSILSITSRIFSERKIEQHVPRYAGLDKEKEEDCMEARNIDYKEFRDEFELQLRNQQKPSSFLDQQKIFAERDLQYHLSQIFTRKEKTIIRSILEDRPISKTDYEYYSRKTKKKLRSIINLSELAKTIYSKNPKYDDELFSLKKKLESWLEKETAEKGIKLLSFLIPEGSGSVAVRYGVSQKIQHGHGNVIHAREIDLSRFLDQGMIDLLIRYKEHEFI